MLWYSFLLIFHPHSLIFHNNGAKPFFLLQKYYLLICPEITWKRWPRLSFSSPSHRGSVETRSHGASAVPLLTMVPPLTPPLVLLRAQRWEMFHNKVKIALWGGKTSLAEVSHYSPCPLEKHFCSLAACCHLSLWSLSQLWTVHPGLLAPLLFVRSQVSMGCIWARCQNG